MKKFILLTYYFPPCGGAGVQRWLRLLKYLPQYGWQPTVITTENGDYPVCDESLLKQIPESLTVIRTKTISFGQFFKSILGKKENIPYGNLQTDKNDSLTKKMLYWLRLNVVLPDARVVWNQSCMNAALNELITDKYACVITTGPPHSTHLVGLKLKKNHKVKWIADFRDPWTKIYYLKLASQNNLIKLFNRQMEKDVVCHADMNLVISQYIADSLPKGKKRVFWNGFDPVDFKGLTYEKSNVFRIKYIGKLTDGQDIHTVLQSISKWLTTNSQYQVEFSFIGTFSEIPADIQSYNFNIRNMEFMQHKDAIIETVNSELLLLLINEYEGNEGMLTTKLFEYIGSRTPILCVGPPTGEAADIIEQFKAGAVCEYNDEKDLLYALEYYYHKWSKGDDIRCDEDISELTAPIQAMKLAKILNNV
jgi:hypothetical protein